MEISFTPLFDEIKNEWCKVLDKGFYNYFSSKSNDIALLNLIKNKSLFEFYEKKIDDSIPLNKAPLIIGVYSDMNTHIDIYTDDFIISTLTLEKNNPQLIIGNKKIIPYLSCPYSTIKITKHHHQANINIIYAEVDFRLSQRLAETKWKISNENHNLFYIFNGYFQNTCFQEHVYYNVPDILSV